MTTLEKLCAARDQMLMAADIEQEMKTVLYGSICRDIEEESDKLFAAKYR